jgi:hypothetical protein
MIVSQDDYQEKGVLFRWLPRAGSTAHKASRFAAEGSTRKVAVNRNLNHEEQQDGHRQPGQ